MKEKNVEAPPPPARTADEVKQAARLEMDTKVAAELERLRQRGELAARVGEVEGLLLRAPERLLQLEASLRAAAAEAEIVIGRAVRKTIRAGSMRKEIVFQDLARCLVPKTFLGDFLAAAKTETKKLETELAAARAALAKFDQQS